MRLKVLHAEDPWLSLVQVSLVMNHASDQSGAAILPGQGGAQHCLPSSSFHLLLLRQWPEVGFPQWMSLSLTRPNSSGVGFI